VTVGVVDFVAVEEHQGHKDSSPSLCSGLRLTCSRRQVGCIFVYSRGNPCGHLAPPPTVTQPPFTGRFLSDFSIPDYTLEDISQEECYIRKRGGNKGLLVSDPPHIIMNAAWKYSIYKDLKCSSRLVFLFSNEPASVTGGMCQPCVAKPGNSPGQVEFYR